METLISTTLESKTHPKRKEMEIIPILVVVLLASLPSKSARKLQQQPPGSEFPPLQSPPMPPETTYLYYFPPESPFPLHSAPAPKFPPPFPDDLLILSSLPPQPYQPEYLLSLPPPPQCPPMPPETTYLYYSAPSPMTFLPPEYPLPLQPAPEFLRPVSDDLLCPPGPPPQTLPLQCPLMLPKTTYLYYSPPQPLMTFLPPEFPFPQQPPPAPEFSSSAPSSYILRWLSGLGSAAVIALLLIGCRMILIDRAAPTPPVQVEMEGVQLEM